MWRTRRPGQIVNLTAGDDEYTNNEDGVTINAGAGKDYISNKGSDVTINMSVGDDDISNSGTNVSINAGEGDDAVWNSGKNVLFKYTEGDGNDLISGFNETSTLQIAGGYGTYSTQRSGSNIIVKVGDGRITLEGARDLETVNIDGSYNGGSHPEVTGTTVTLTQNYDYYENREVNVKIDALGGDGNDSLVNWGATEVTINAGKGNDFVENDGDLVTVDAGAGDDTIDLFLNGSGNVISYATGDGDDTIRVVASTELRGSDFTIKLTDATLGSSSTSADGDIILHVGNNTLTIKDAQGEGIYVVDKYGEETVIKNDRETLDANYDNDKLITVPTDDRGYYIENSGDNVTIKESNFADGVYNSGDTVSIDAGSGNDYIDNNGNNATLDGGEDNDYVHNIGANVSILGGDGNDHIYGGGLSASLSGGAGNDYISINERKEWNEDTQEMEVVSTPDNATITGGTGNDSIYNDGGANVLFKYMAGDGNDKITGFNETSTLKVEGAKYSKTISDKDIIVTVGAGKITLVGAASLGSVNIDGEEEPGKWSYKSGKATYTVNGKAAITVSGVKSKDGISVSGTTVTIANSAFNKTKVTVTAGYTLALDTDVTQKAVSTKTWSSVKNNSSTYTEAKSAYYTLATNGKSVTYTKEGAPKTLATLKGIKSVDGLKVDGNVITVSNSALTTANVTLGQNDKFTLALDDDVTQTPEYTSATWKRNKTTATFVQKTKAVVYTPAANGKSITYTKSGTEQTLTTITGLKNSTSTEGIALEGNTITLSKNVLTTTDVKIIGDYKLALGDGIKSVAIKSGTWSAIKNGAATLNGSMSDGYTLAPDEKSVTYTKATKNNAVLATINGVKKTAGITLSGNAVVLSSSNFGDKVTVSGTAAFDFAADFSNATIAGTNAAENIIVNGSGVSIAAGKGNDLVKVTGSDATINAGAGNDTLWGSDHDDTFIYGNNDGADVIFGFGTDDLLSITGTGAFGGKVSGDDVICTFGKTTITLKDCAANETFKVGDDTYRIDSATKKLTK